MFYLYLINKPSTISTDDVVFAQSAIYAQKLLWQICRYQREGCLCDTVIVTDDGQLSAHSVVLMAASPVFQAALKITGSPREHIVVIPGVTLSAMKTVLQFVYTGEIVPVPDDMTSVVSLLLELQLVCLKQIKYVHCLLISLSK